MGLASDIYQMNVGQLFQTPPSPSFDFTGQTIVITGANTGLGFEAAKHVFGLNASHIIIACRSLTKGEEARKKVITSAPRPGKVEIWQIDLSDYSSVIAFGKRIDALSRLDAFIANAGIDVKHWSLSEGNESTITVNVVSTMLVSMLGIPKLRQTAMTHQRSSHLTLTGSVVHIFAKDRYAGSLQFEQTCTPVSVSANGWKALSTARQQSLPVIANFVKPGWCKTELFRTNDGGFGGRVGLRLIGRTAEEGSRTLVHAIVAGEASHGKYLSDCRIKPESSFVRSDASISVQKGLWSELVDILENIAPVTTKVLD